MKFIITFLSIAVFLPAKAQFKKSDTLRYITDYAVKVDGGCSFYTTKDIALNMSYPHDKNKYKLIIAHLAFIQTGPHAYLLFKKARRAQTKSGYIDYFIGKTGSLTLAIDTIIKSGEFTSIRKGTLKVATEDINTTVKVHGRCEELDSYNGYSDQQLKKQKSHP